MRQSSSAMMMLTKTRTLLLLLCIGATIGTSIGATNTSTTRSSASGRVKPKATPAPVIIPVDATVMKENELATLQCSGAQVIAWYHNRTQRLLTNELTDEKGNPGKFVVVDSTLNITKVSRADVGVYICYDGLTRTNYSVQLFMKPGFVRELSQSLNMAEGEPLRLACDSFGWPPPQVKWVRSNPVANFMQQLTANVTATDPRIVANGSLLTIYPAARSDYMLYTCIAINSVGSTNSTTLVRVKGKLTALWPFLGIVIEVVILIVVIIYFEKKKAKELAHNKSTQDEDEKLMKAQQGKDSVRQRK